MVQLTDEDRCRIACVHLQTIANRHDGVLINGNITKVAKDSHIGVRMLKQYIKDNNIDFKKGDGYEIH